MRRSYADRMAMVPTEQEEQIALFKWADLAKNYHPELRLMFSIANEAGRFRNLRYAGVVRGVPDIFLACGRGRYLGMFLELKRLKGGKVAYEQFQWLSQLQEAGYYAVVARGFEEARIAIVNYLEGSNGEIAE